MTTAANSTVALVATRQMAGQSADRPDISAVMQAVHGWFSHKPSEHLSEIVGCDVETARRYFAGKRSPNGETLIAMLAHPVGVAMVEEATRRLPPAEYEAFWREMSKAALRAFIRENNTR